MAEKRPLANYDGHTETLRSGDSVPGAVTDGDKGDITVSGSGSTWTLDATAIDGKSAATPTVDDLLLIADESDSWNLKKISIDDILTLIGSSGLSQAQVMARNLGC